jgi:hypothetical protein
MKFMKNLRYYLYTKLTFLRDKTGQPLTRMLDYVRYNVLYDHEDKRHWYD